MAENEQQVANQSRRARLPFPPAGEYLGFQVGARRIFNIRKMFWTNILTDTSIS
jgi:hypothetical protein